MKVTQNVIRLILASFLIFVAGVFISIFILHRLPCPHYAGLLFCGILSPGKEVARMKSAYKAAIERMLKNIDDEKALAMIYRYIVYIYTRKK